MKIETTVQKLSIAVNKLQRVSSKNLSLPILENILLINKDNILLIRSTNLHVGVEISITVKSDVDGEISINLDVFTNIINSLNKEDKIFLELKDKILKIKTKSSEMEINTYDSSDFPSLPKIQDGLDFIIPINEFINGIKSVYYAASLSDIKPEISSVYIYKKDNELVFVATDSFRLAEKKIIIDGVNDFPGIIIPIKNIQEIIRVFNDVEGEVLMEIGKNQISLKNNEIYFTSRIVDGNYPNYTQIIPKEEKISVIVLKNDIISSLKLINVFSDNYNQIKLKINSKKSILSFFSKNSEVGENNTDIEAVVNGGDMEMFINHKYITDSFNSLNEDSIQFSFTEKNKPFILKSVGDKSFLYLVMPMNR
jgi:DNA polymerase-3 subunit beta